MLLAAAFAFAAEPSYTLADVAAHATVADCWVVVDGGVYDVTPFLAGHPGGPLLQEACGTDASALFHHRPGSGTDHSDAARVILAGLRVGGLPGAAPLSRPDRLAWRARSGLLASVPTPVLPPAHALRADVSHTLGEAANVRMGFAYAITDKVAVELVHATLDGESDVGVAVAHGSRTFRGGVRAGVGYRFRNVPEGDGLGVYAELPLELRLAQEWVSLHLTPGLAVLPRSAGEVARPGGGFGVALRPWPVLSLFGQGDWSWGSAAPEWAAGVRIHTTGHTFAAWAGSSYALGALDRLAPGTPTDFAVGFALVRDFDLAPRRR